MKRALFLILLCCSSSAFLVAQTTARQQGTIIRMRLAGCPGPQHGFMMALSGSARVQPDELCPEYTLLTEKVVYVIVGRASTQLVPLAEVTKFRLQNKELLIRIDDANRESRFMIKSMTLRADWEREQQREEEEMRAVARHEREVEMMLQNAQ